VISTDGETISLVDDEGHALSHTEAMLALVRLVCETGEHARIAVPVSITREAERVAMAHGGEVIWTKRSDAHLMEVVSEGGVTFAASPLGGFIWPDFLPAYDAIATFGHVLELLAIAGQPLSAIVKTLPRVHMVHEVVPTAWERKGTVMRELIEHSSERELVLVDGVKVMNDQGWALVLPDPERPVMHVWAEADSDHAARTLAAEYARAIRHALRVPV
jgi:mannose-1-phosphate guanylyltransferase/phosphomannomutase